MSKLIIITAPSGAGKTTIVRHLLKSYDQLAFSISATTREKRAHEEEGVDYYFIDKDAFAAMRQQGLFLEWAEVHGNLYGTSSSEVQEATERGKDIILDIDVEGARQVKEKLGAKGIFIFISPPSLEELESRLAGRCTESESAIATRLANAEEEMKSIGQYEYVIVNDSVEQAVEVLKAIIIAARSRNRRGLSGEPLNLVF